MTHHNVAICKLAALLLLTCCVTLDLNAASGPPVVTQQPATQTVLQGSPVTFSVLVDGTTPFQYQWLRDGFAIPQATNNSYTLTLTTANDHGATFAVRVTNSLGNTLSSNAMLRIDPGVIVTETVNLLTMDSSWKYNAQGTSLGTVWRDVGYNDTAWPSGLGVFDWKNTGRTTIGGEAIRTTLPLASGVSAAYFRTTFNLTNQNVATVRLSGRVMIDDGAIFYLNGKEMLPYYVNSGAGYGDYATRTVGDAAWEGPIEFASTNVVLGTNVIAVEGHQVNSGSSDLTFMLTLDAELGHRVPDTIVPTVVGLNPPQTATVRNLEQIEVFFSEPVEGVDAGDLLINGVPATQLDGYSYSQYVFHFPVPPTGAVQVAWAPNHGIRDMAVTPNLFAGGSWSYLLDPNAVPPSVIINEFLAGNNSGIRDASGDQSDWIELYNSGSTAVNLQGWYLTDVRTNLTQWRFPGVTMPAKTYLLVWASGKDWTNITGQLHTNFKLDKGGEYLGLVDPSLAVVSEFAPVYPVQTDDISYGRDRLNPNISGYFQTPTPNAANSTGGPGFAPEVHFSVRSGVFSAPFTLELTTENPAAEIHYVLVTTAAGAANSTNVPSLNSPRYTDPLSITGTTEVRARAFLTGLLPGKPRTEAYLQVAANMLTNSSDLPIGIMHNFGGGTPPASPTDQIAWLAIWEPIGGRTSVTNPPSVFGRVNVHRRGSSTLGQAKMNLKFEFLDEFSGMRDVEVLGMPEESDWVFYAPNNFEPVFIHNAWMHELSRDVGRYSPRTRFLEMFINITGGQVNAPGGNTGDYYGIYLVEEQIKVAPGRVEIDKVQPGDTNAIDRTGGYLLKVDRSGGNDRTITAGGTTMVWESPNGLDIATGLYNNQVSYVQSYFDTFYSVLQSANWTNPVTGYRAYIDEDSWIDHHLLNVISFNIDALRLSAFLYKPRNEKINMGPLWDYDRTLGSQDGRDFNPRRWRSVTPDYGTEMFNTDGIFANLWYSRMFRDIDFWQRYIDRYQQLRKKEFSNQHIHELVDYYCNQLRESQLREQVRWGAWNAPRSGNRTVDGYSYNFSGTFQGEIDFMKKWLSDRVDFMDTNWLAMPSFNIEGGEVPAGFVIAITPPAAPAGSTIYYTLDGSDPREWNTGGKVATSAQVYSGPIVVSSNVTITARAYNAAQRNLTGVNNPPLSSSWSGPISATYVVHIPPVRITEIMYHPQNPPLGNTNSNEAFEYIEVKNVGSTPLNLVQFRISGGVDFVFPSLVLDGGQSAVVVANIAAFRTRYGTGVTIAGYYTNKLNNAGEKLVLWGPTGEFIMEVKYSDEWYPITDGNGFSLVVRDENATLAAWNTAENWRVSGVINGSPGADDPPAPTFPQVVINEILTHTDPPTVDTVELYNPGPGPADISNWYLTDDFRLPRKFRIPTPTIIPEGEYILFDETDFNYNPSLPNNFAFSSKGDQVYLFSGDENGVLTGYYEGFDFGAVETGVTFGRYILSTGHDHHPAQISPTLGGLNAGPRVGPVVISEVMYHPVDYGSGKVFFDNTFDEYIELYNITAEPVPLYSASYPANTWHLRDAVDYTFPSNTTIAPLSYILVVAFDPSDASLANSFRARFGVPSEVPIYGPFDGKLQNSGESVELVFPDNPEPPGTPDAGYVPYVLVDRVKYEDAPPWPVAADGTGYSLQRLSLTAYGNDPINWAAASPTPGAANVFTTAPTILQQPTNQIVRVGTSPNVVVVATANPGPVRYQWRFNGANLPGYTGSYITLLNIQPEQAGTYDCVVMTPGASVLSSPATLQVVWAPSIVVQPRDVTAWGSTNVSDYGKVATNVYLNCIVGGTLPFTFQWYYNSTIIPGAVDATLALSNVTPLNEGLYSVVVNNISGSVTSTLASLSVLLPPVVLESPVSTNVFSGNTVNLKVRVQGGPLPFGYTWMKDGVVLTNIVLYDTNCTYTMVGVTTANSGNYTVTITNAAVPNGITTPPALLQIYTPPQILVPPTNQTAIVGSTVRFSVAATGVGDLTYQWYKGSTLIPTTGNPTATNEILVLANVQTADEAAYRVRVRNPAGSSMSQSGTLTVIPAPSLAGPQVAADAFSATFSGGRSNYVYRIEYTTNFVDWSLLKTITYSNTPVPFSDTWGIDIPARFYRVKSQ